MAHSQSRVAPLLLIGGRATPVLLKKHSQTRLGWPEVTLWVHRLQKVVLRDPAIELASELFEHRRATDALVKGVLSHCLLREVDLGGLDKPNAGGIKGNLEAPPELAAHGPLIAGSGAQADANHKLLTRDVLHAQDINV